MVGSDRGTLPRLARPVGRPAALLPYPWSVVTRVYAPAAGNVRGGPRGSSRGGPGHGPRGGHPPMREGRGVGEAGGRRLPLVRGGQVADVADPDQPVAEVVAPLLDGERVVDERVGVAGGVLGGVLGPALGVCLVGVVAVVEAELGPRHP